VLREVASVGKAFANGTEELAFEGGYMVHMYAARFKAKTRMLGYERIQVKGGKLFTHTARTEQLMQGFVDNVGDCHVEHRSGMRSSAHAVMGSTHVCCLVCVVCSV
jgi:hypothetical protein